jgi:ribosomal protein S18 acetylase RimI-like enzyme
MTLTKDTWLSGIFGYDVYRLTIDKSLKGSYLPLDRAFVYAKVPVDNVQAGVLLQKLGFYVVDTNVVFRKPFSYNGAHGNMVRFAQQKDEDGVRKVAYGNFEYSRFHLDQRIPNSLADKIKAEWAGNYFKGKRGDEMIVALSGDTVIGFTQLLYKGDELIIDLIAVDKSHRGKGVASDMIEYAEERCPQHKFTTVGTQVANVPSVRLYEKLGFRLHHAEYVYHYHKD